MPEIYSFSDYRKYLRAVIKHNSDVWGYQTRLAEAAGCQRSFLSQVLSGKSGLTLDHAAGASQYLNLSEDEAHYFLDLINLDRAATQTLKKMISERLENQKSKREHLGTRFSEQTFSSSEFNEQIYYSSWHFAAIHILTGIPEFQTANAIASRLGISIHSVNATLNKLREMQLVDQDRKGQWKISNRRIHLAKESPMSFANHQNWRQQALLDLPTDHHAVHYTAVHSMAVIDFPRFKSILLKAIDETRSLVIQSQSEELTCFTCDFFTVARPRA